MSRILCSDHRRLHWASENIYHTETYNHNVSNVCAFPYHNQFLKYEFQGTCDSHPRRCTSSATYIHGYTESTVNREPCTGLAWNGYCFLCHENQPPMCESLTLHRFKDCTTYTPPLLQAQPKVRKASRIPPHFDMGRIQSDRLKTLRTHTVRML